MSIKSNISPISSLIKEIGINISNAIAPRIAIISAAIGAIAIITIGIGAIGIARSIIGIIGSIII